MLEELHLLGIKVSILYIELCYLYRCFSIWTYQCCDRGK